MKKQKMSLANIKDVLSRDEMAAIMAGSPNLCGYCMVNGTMYACAKQNEYTGCLCLQQVGKPCYTV